MKLFVEDVRLLVQSASHFLFTMRLACSTVLTVISCSSVFCQVGTGPSPSLGTPDVGSVVGYRYGIVYNFSASVGKNNTSNTNANFTASSNVFHGTEFNSLFGYGVEYKRRLTQGLIFNVTDQTSVSDPGEFGRKLLLPTQSGFVFNAYRQEYKDGIDPLDFDEADHVQSRSGYYLVGGLTPAELKVSDSKVVGGWIHYGSLGWQFLSPHFKLEQGTVGFQLRAGLTYRSLISGFSDGDFWTTLRPNNGRNRTYLGEEIQLSVDIGGFKPTLLWTNFDRGGHTPNFSGSQVNVLFDIGNLVNFNNSKVVSSPKLIGYMVNRLKTLERRKVYLTDRDAEFFTSVVEQLKGNIPDTDIVQMKNNIAEMKKREKPVGMDNPSYVQLIGKLTSLQNSTSGSVDTNMINRAIKGKSSGDL